jgi:hypothetical protein
MQCCCSSLPVGQRSSSDAVPRSRSPASCCICAQPALLLLLPLLLLPLLLL